MSEAVAFDRYNAEEYYKAIKDREGRTELLDGEIVDLASPSFRHQTIADGMIAELRSFVRKNGGKCRPISAFDVKLDDFNIVVPDIMIGCDPEKFDTQKYNGAPDFVAEIVSSNRGNDLFRKLWLYQRSGVREYWIIDPRHERVSVYCFAEESFPEIPEVYGFDTPIPVHIWDGKLTITIAELERM